MIRIWDLNVDELCLKHLLKEHYDLLKLWDFVVRNERPTDLTTEPEYQRWHRHGPVLLSRWQAQAKRLTSMQAASIELKDTANLLEGYHKFTWPKPLWPSARQRYQLCLACHGCRLLNASWRLFREPAATQLEFLPARKVKNL